MSFPSYPVQSIFYTVAKESFCENINQIVSFSCWKPFRVSPLPSSTMCVPDWGSPLPVDSGSCLFAPGLLALAQCSVASGPLDPTSLSVWNALPLAFVQLAPFQASNLKCLNATLNGNIRKTFPWTVHMKQLISVTFYLCTLFKSPYKIYHAQQLLY